MTLNFSFPAQFSTSVLQTHGAKIRISDAISSFGHEMPKAAVDRSSIICEGTHSRQQHKAATDSLALGPWNTSEAHFRGRICSFVSRMRLLTSAIAIAKLGSALSAASPTVLSSAYDGSFLYLLGSSNQPYYVAPTTSSKAVLTVPVPNLGSELVPFTVLTTSASLITNETIRDAIEGYLGDDVYQAGFLEGLST